MRINFGFCSLTKNILWALLDIRFGTHLNHMNQIWMNLVARCFINKKLVEKCWVDPKKLLRVLCNLSYIIFLSTISSTFSTLSYIVRLHGWGKYFTFSELTLQPWLWGNSHYNIGLSSTCGILFHFLLRSGGFRRQLFSTPCR